MTAADYSLVNAVHSLAQACIGFDWRGVVAVVNEAHDNGARVVAARRGNVINLRVVAERVDAVRSVAGLHAKDADAILSSLCDAGAEVQL